MNNLTDNQLLSDYAKHQSEAAFAELVRRHVDLVYSAALRMVCDTHSAKDVTQGVFLALAQNARRLTKHPVLSGWLHYTTRNLAAKAVRSDVRRRVREQEAAVMNELLSGEPDISWEQIAPHLDAGLGELNDADRDAILLRYFERKSASEMAKTLGITDDAAQKRVSRGVERLREFFAKRGGIAGTGLLAVISANAVQAAPVGLVVEISTAVTAATITTTTIATHTTMTWITAKFASALLAAAVVAGVGTHLVKQRELNRLKAENQSLFAQQYQSSTERDAALSALSQRNDEVEHFRKDKNELLKLRGEVGVLRRQVLELGKLQEENKKLSALSPSKLQPNTSFRLHKEVYVGGKHFPKESWAFAGYDNPEAALATWTWAMSKGDKAGMLASLVPEAQAEWQKLFEGKSNEQIAKNFAGGSEKLAGYTLHSKKILSESEVIVAFVMDLPDGSQGSELGMTLKKIGEDWKIVGPTNE